jgi:amino acid efflux transporter
MNSAQKLNLWQGAALLATTLLGTGVFILPQLTIAQAGPFASWAWLLLTVLAIPVTFVFAALARVLPHAAGPAHFVGEAFGPLAGRVTGLMFVLVVPLGASAAMMMTYSFVAPLLAPFLGDLRYWQLPVELLFLLLLWLLNRRGVQLSAKLQLGLTLLIVAVVLLMFGAFALQTDPMPLPETASLNVKAADFNAAGFSAALALGFWSFLGVEAMTHLAQDFRDPKRHLVPALLLGLLVVGCIYLGCSYLLQILAQPGEDLSMADGFNRLFGGGGYLLIGLLGLCSGLATVNVYTASVARLCWSFSSNGILPKALRPLNRHQVPERALGSILLLMAVVLCGAEWLDAGLPDLIGWVNGVFVLIYLGSMTAALRLLAAKYRLVVWVSIGICLLLVWMLGTAMSYAILLIMITAPLLWWQQQWLRARTG